MIGHFKDAGSAAKTKQIIDWFTEQVNHDVDAGELQVGSAPQRLTERMMELFRKVNTYIIGPAEVEQFVYDVGVELSNEKIVITTDESDVSAFLKVLVDQGARVEVFSAHYYRDGKGFVD